MCLSCEVKPSPALKAASADEPGAFQAALIDHLVPFISKPPLEILAGALRDYGATQVATKIFGAYDQFLAILDDPARRDVLKKLAVDAAVADGDFQETRELAREFQDGLATLFFGTDPPLTEAAQTHGVF